MITAWEAARYQDASVYARGALEDALKSKNVGKKKTKAVIFYDGPEKTCHILF